MSAGIQSCTRLFCKLAKHKGGSIDMNGEGEGGASNAIWAIALIIIVGIIMGALYYGGILSGKQKKEIDVEVSVPATNR